MKGKLFLVAFLLVALFASFASALPTVEQVKINGDVFASGDQLVVERGETLNIRVKLSSVADEVNTQVTADILGYEHSPYVSGLSDATSVFDLNANDTVYKDLTLKVPEDAEKDYYDLRIRVATRAGQAFEGLYKLHLKGSRHNVIIKDVLFTPENRVKSGRALLAVVRVKNIGEKDEQGIKVKVSIPDLGISAADYIDELKADESTSSEELYLRIPDCAEDGTYNVNVEIEYNDGYSTDKVTKTINVIQQDTCKPVTPAETPSEKTVVSVPSQPQDLKSGTGSVYPITITNAGSTSQTYVVSVEGADWATTKISPSNVVVVKSGETKFVYIYITPTQTAEEGEHVFNVKVAAGDQEKTFSMKGNVVKSSQDNLKRGLEISLIILLIVLIIIGLIVGLSKLKGGSSESSNDEETSYY